MRCVHCGRELREGTVYCTFCGTAVRARTTADPRSAPAVPKLEEPTQGAGDPHRPKWSRRHTGIAVGSAVLLAAAAAGGTYAATHSEPIPPPTSAAAATAQATVATTAALATTTTTSAVATTTSRPALTTIGENVTMVVNVTDGSCWLVVRDDSEGGAELYAGTLSAGGQQTFDDSKRYWMIAGRPEVLAITVNGAVHTLAPPAGSFIITESGIERNGQEVVVPAASEKGVVVCVVRRGDILHIEASGVWGSGGVKPDRTASEGGPDGIRSPDPGEGADLMLPGHLIGLLIGRVGRWVFPVGSAARVEVQEDGTLHLLMNDRKGHYADNYGELEAYFSVE